jgi:hypothetical protein
MQYRTRRKGMRRLQVCGKGKVNCRHDVPQSPRKRHAARGSETPSGAGGNAPKARIQAGRTHF